jgi:hypothetical protein
MRLIKVGVTGRNALDLTLAYYLGRASLENPRAEFHIISRDTDYDAMIEHVNRHGIRVDRSPTVAELDFLTHAPAGGAPASQQGSMIDEVVELLDRSEASRPKTLKRLRSSISSWFPNDRISESELDGIIDALVDEGIIAIDDRGRVSYSRR